MIVLFTDYGLEGPYVGEVEAQLFRYAPSEKVIRLINDVPRQNVKAGAYLLAALSGIFPNGTIFFSVIDPGVGSGRDKPVVIRMGEHRYVGPHNGLFDIVTRHGGDIESWEITWTPPELSGTFHGRDLYAPVCAMIANQQPIPGKSMVWKECHNWPDELHEIIYFDGFGNAWTGLHAEKDINTELILEVNGSGIKHADTFAAVTAGEPFWYINSSGLIEIAVNQGSARETLGLEVGSGVNLYKK